MTPAQLAVFRLYCDEVARAWTVILSATWQLPIALQQQAPKRKPVPVSDYAPDL